MTTSELRAAFDLIQTAEDAGAIQEFRAKYPGKCFVCKHSFKVPVELVYKVETGKIACWDCYQTALFKVTA